MELTDFTLPLKKGQGPILRQLFLRPFPRYSKRFVNINYNRLTDREIEQLKRRNEWIWYLRQRGADWKKLREVFNLSESTLMTIFFKLELAKEREREQEAISIKEALRNEILRED